MSHEWRRLHLGRGHIHQWMFVRPCHSYRRPWAESGVPLSRQGWQPEDAAGCSCRISETRSCFRVWSKAMSQKERHYLGEPSCAKNEYSQEFWHPSSSLLLFTFFPFWEKNYPQFTYMFAISIQLHNSSWQIHYILSIITCPKPSFTSISILSISEPFTLSPLWN